MPLLTEADVTTLDDDIVPVIVVEGGEFPRELDAVTCVLYDDDDDGDWWTTFLERLQSSGTYGR